MCLKYCAHQLLVLTRLKHAHTGCYYKEMRKSTAEIMTYKIISFDPICLCFFNVSVNSRCIVYVKDLFEYRNTKSVSSQHYIHVDFILKSISNKTRVVL